MSKWNVFYKPQIIVFDTSVWKRLSSNKFYTLSLSPWKEGFVKEMLIYPTGYCYVNWGWPAIIALFQKPIK